MPRLIEYHNRESPASFSVMRLVLFRHAERANSGVENPPLSSRGEEQSLQLIKLVEENKIESPQKLISSPKLRARQTFLPLAKKRAIDILTWDDLDERSSSENS